MNLNFQNKLDQLFIFIVLFSFVLIFGMFQGCSLTEVTPQKQLIGIYDQYNTQYYDYMYSTGYVKEDGAWIKKSSPILTDKRKEILRKKKEVLVKVYPLIILYDNLLSSGGKIPPELMPQIINLLNQLTTIN